MINSIEDAIFMIQGENMAIIFMLKAVISTHPNPESLRAMVELFQRQSAAALKAVPPANLQLFRFEQLLDQLIAEIPRKGATGGA